jgi:hypothetical protein
MEGFWEFLADWNFLGASSEKGYTRKHTENWVARCRFKFWGNLGIIRCFAKRILLGEFKFNDFLRFGRGSTWGY